MTALLTLDRLTAISNAWFENLPNPIRTEVVAQARHRTLTAGQRLFIRGDAPDGIYCVLKGAVCVSGLSVRGQLTLLDFYGPGSWFGEVSALDGLPRTHDAEAYDATTLLHLEGQEFDRLLAAHPAFCRGVLQLEALRLRLLLTALETYSTQSFEQRLASRLLMLAVTFGVDGPDGVKIHLHLPQETLAQLIGSTRQRVNQILRNLDAAGLVKHQYGRLLLCDRQRLEALVQS